jgi:hypothetical protein
MVYISLLKGTEIHENSNLEFKYSEPYKLTEIEEIFSELFIANYKNPEYFYRRTNKLVYFDDNFLNKINELVEDSSSTLNLDNVYNKVNNYFFEVYSKNRHSLYNDSQSKQSRKEEKRELIMYITKEEIIREFFKGNEKRKNLNKLDKTLNLSKIDDVAGNDVNDVSLDFNQKISLSDILMKDWESKRQHQYEPIENSVEHNKIEILNNINFYDPIMNRKSNGNETNNN